jgi:hypothetical protein
MITGYMGGGGTLKVDKEYVSKGIGVEFGSEFEG